MKKGKVIISRLLIGVLTVGMIFATGCSKKTETTAEKVAVTVNDKDVYLNDMMYYIFAIEAQGNQYEQLYQQYYGSSYWDSEYSEGVTVREQMKNYVMDTAVMYEILYEKAQEEGLTLTDEEKTQTETTADNILAQITDEEQLKLTGFTKESLTNIQQKLAIGEKYYDEMIDGFDIDDQKITDSINKDDYRQYNTEYLFVATTTYDDSYNPVALSDEEKATAKDAITAALDKAKTGETFADIVADDSTITTNTLNFVKDDGQAEAAYQEAALSLDNDAITDDIVETDTGYYVIKMVDNNSTESYDSAVDSAISSAENDAFTTAYDELKKAYTITVNNDVWDPIVMGETTIVKTETTPAAGNSDSSTDSTNTDTSSDSSDTTSTDSSDSTSGN